METNIYIYFSWPSYPRPCLKKKITTLDLQIHHYLWLGTTYSLNSFLTVLFLEYSMTLAFNTSMFLEPLPHLFSWPSTSLDTPGPGLWLWRISAPSWPCFLPISVAHSQLLYKLCFLRVCAFLRSQDNKVPDFSWTSTLAAMKAHSRGRFRGQVGLSLFVIWT